MSSPLPSPTLRQIAIESLCRSVEHDSISHYEKFQPAIVHKKYFEKVDTLFSRIFSSSKREFSPVETVLSRTYEMLLTRDPQFLTARVLSAIERQSPEFFDDRNWQRLYETRWGAVEYEPKTDFKTVYLVKHFLESFARAGRDVSKIPPKDLALFTENAPSCEGIEVLDSDIYLTDELICSMANFMPRISTIILTGATRVTSKGLISLISSHLRTFHIGSILLSADIIKSLKSHSTNLESLQFSALERSITQSDLNSFFKRLNLIQELKIGGVDELNDDAFLGILSPLKRLRRIHLFNLSGLSLSIILELPNRFPLENLRINACQGLPEL